jgi:hypothetical protein
MAEIAVLAMVTHLIQRAVFKPSVDPVFRYLVVGIPLLGAYLAASWLLRQIERA